MGWVINRWVGWVGLGLFGLDLIFRFLVDWVVLHFSVQKLA